MRGLRELFLFYFSEKRRLHVVERAVGGQSTRETFAALYGLDCFVGIHPLSLSFFKNDKKKRKADEENDFAPSDVAPVALLLFSEMKRQSYDEKVYLSSEEEGVRLEKVN